MICPESKSHQARNPLLFPIPPWNLHSPLSFLMLERGTYISLSAIIHGQGMQIQCSRRV